MRVTPTWSKLTAVAHTLVYDATIMNGDQAGRPLSATRWSSVTMPILLMDGGKSPLWMHNAVAALQRVLPNARYQQLPGEKHRVSAEAVAPALLDFFGRLAPGEALALRQRRADAGTVPSTR
jgi:hypothetical protein